MSDEALPRVSVIVPAHGVAHLLGEALASLQRQSFIDWEAIVIDDGAPDDVAAAFRPFAGDQRMRLLLTERQGVSAARNRAVAAARAPLIALLDGDDAYEPDYLATMVAAIEGDPALGFVTCDAVYFGAADRAGRRFSDFYPQRGAIALERVLDHSFCVFVGCTIRTVAFRAVGGFDAALGGAEDLDLWLRLLTAGWGAKMIDRPLVRYRRRAGSLSTNRQAMLSAACTVYAKAAAALAGRPERAAAVRMLDRVRTALDHLDGERLILAGESRRGIALLAKAPHRSLRWRVAVPVMQVFPSLARPIIRLRSILPEPARPANRPDPPA